MSAPKLIGELNGKWSMLFKVSLVATPLAITLIVSWGTWATAKVYAHDLAIGRLEAWKDIGPRFTPSDAQALELRVKQDIAAVNQRRFDEVIAKVEVLTTAINDLKVALAKYERQRNETRD